MPDVKIDTFLQKPFSLDYAINYCENKFSVFPLAPKDKKPILNSWKSYQNTRADKEQVVSWFSNTENNIAISTGKVSGIIVFDIDGKEAGKYFEDTVQKIGDEEIKVGIKDTMRIRTGSNNVNIVVGFDPAEFPDGEEIKNSILWRGSNNSNNSNNDHCEIRLKAEGGYIVAPPSIHPNGNRYELINDISSLSPVRLSKKRIIKLITELQKDKKKELDLMASSANQVSNEDVFDIAAFLKPYYRQGERNDFVMYLAGWLRKEGIAIECVCKVVEELAENDEEKQARFRTVQETYKKENLDGVGGYSGLLSILANQLQSEQKASQLLLEVKSLFPIQQDQEEHAATANKRKSTVQSESVSQTLIKLAKAVKYKPLQICNFSKCNATFA